MTYSSRRDFLQTSLAAAGGLAGAAFTTTASAQEGYKPGGDALVETTVQEGWSPLKVIDTNAMDWGPGRAWQRKMLFLDPKSQSHIMLLKVGPGWMSIPSHYHEFHEWGYFLSGDMVSNEYVSADQTIGAFTQYREGFFLDRPAYSLHGIEPGRLSSQQGCVMIIHEENWGNFGVLSGADNYDAKSEKVKQYSMPRIIDTVSQLLWQDDGNVPGLKVKRLADDPERGYRANLLWLPAGWSAERAPEYAQAYHYKKAREFNYVLYGDLALQAFAAPDAAAERIDVSVNHYFERGPNTICGLADGTVTQGGCVWLQVTYAKANAVVTSKRIEEPIRV